MCGAVFTIEVKNIFFKLSLFGASLTSVGPPSRSADWVQLIRLCLLLAPTTITPHCHASPTSMSLIWDFVQGLARARKSCKKFRKPAVTRP
jgi:hypothetical protein